MGAKPCFSSTVSASQRSNFIQEASGEREAPLGKSNPVDESNTTPNLV